MDVSAGRQEFLVAVNRCEAVIEVFWDAAFEAPKRWSIVASGKAREAGWFEHSGYGLAWRNGEGRGTVQIEQACDLAVDGIETGHSRG